MFISLNLLPEFPHKPFVFTATLRITQCETTRIKDKLSYWAWAVCVKTCLKRTLSLTGVCLIFLRIFLLSFCRMRVNLEWGLLYLVLTKSTHPVKAYKKTQEIVVSTTDHSRKYHNIPWYSLLAPKLCISIVFSFAWGQFNSQEKLKTMRMQNFWVANKEYYGMLLYFLEWSIQCRIQSLRWGRGGGGVGDGHPNPEKRGGGLWKIFFDRRASIWSENKGGGGSLDPSPGSVTAIIRGRINMAMRTVYVEYCKLPLISLPTFKPFRPTYVPIYS